MYDLKHVYIFVMLFNTIDAQGLQKIGSRLLLKFDKFCLSVSSKENLMIRLKN